jgi:hypothetical protein
MAQVNLPAIASLVRSLAARYVHGERVVRPIDPLSRHRVEVLDFGITPSRVGAPDETDRSELCTTPTTIPRDRRNPFINDVTTRLQYRRSVRELDDGGRYVWFLIDQDRIIGVNNLVGCLWIS